MAPILLALLRGSASLTRTFAGKLGTSAATAGSVVRAIRQDPMAAAFIAYEMGEEAAPVLDLLMEHSADVRAWVTSKQPVQKADLGDLDDVVELKDEFATIDNAIRQFGGLEALLTLRRFMAIPDETIQARLTVEDLA